MRFLFFYFALGGKRSKWGINYSYGIYGDVRGKAH